MKCNRFSRDIPILSQQVNDNTKRIDTLERLIDEDEGIDLQPIEDDIKALQEKDITHNNRLTYLENKTNEIESDISSIKHELDNIDFNELESDITNIQTQVSTNSNRVQALESANIYTQQRLTNIDDVNNEQNNDIAIIKDRLIELGGVLQEMNVISIRYRETLVIAGNSLRIPVSLVVNPFTNVTFSVNPLNVNAVSLPVIIPNNTFDSVTFNNTLWEFQSRLPHQTTTSSHTLAIRRIDGGDFEIVNTGATHLDVSIFISLYQ